MNSTDRSLSSYRPEGFALSVGRVLAVSPCAVPWDCTVLTVELDDPPRTARMIMPTVLWQTCREFVRAPGHRVRFHWYETREIDRMVNYLTSITPLHDYHADDDADA